ncbi:MAG TPA: hypothetical protein VNC50_22880, partial [Planctomycetia bacterium]|nr:hypothetical protein [Planctomycetia bacterium]
APPPPVAEEVDDEEQEEEEEIRPRKRKRRRRASEANNNLVMIVGAVVALLALVGIGWGVSRFFVSDGIGTEENVVAHDVQIGRIKSACGKLVATLSRATDANSAKQVAEEIKTQVPEIRKLVFEAKSLFYSHPITDEQAAEFGDQLKFDLGNFAADALPKVNEIMGKPVLKAACAAPYYEWMIALAELDDGPQKQTLIAELNKVKGTG